VNDESGKQKLACADNEKRVKNDQKTGSKKGQKWPKMGVQKRVKKGSKIEFFEPTKKVINIKRTLTNIKIINNITIAKYSKKYDEWGNKKISENQQK
jgi:hypothetical protein